MVERSQIIFREATVGDLPFMLDLYNYYLLNTTAAFDYEKISVEELQARLSFQNKKYGTFLVYDSTDTTVLGFCFLTQFRKKPAYDRTAEMGIYLKPENTGKKIGQSIVQHLEEYARQKQIEVIIATISGENIGSIKLFEKMGYAQCAHFREVAIKFNRRLDLMHYEKIL